MAIFRKAAPKGETYSPNEEPPEEYTATVHVPSLSRRQQRASGYTARTRLPKGKRA